VYARSRLSAYRWQQPSSDSVKVPKAAVGENVRRLNRDIAAKLGFKAHPHMFRHACGFQLANQGTDTRTLQAYLGHRNIQHTVRYTELSPARFKNLWRD